MSNYEEPLQQSTVKTSRLRAIFRPKHASIDPNKPSLKAQTGHWVNAHPWSVLGVCLGAAGILGYNLGVRS